MVLPFCLHQSELPMDKGLEIPLKVNPALSLFVEWPAEKSMEKVQLHLKRNKEFIIKCETGPRNFMEWGPPDVIHHQGDLCAEWTQYGIRFTITSEAAFHLEWSMTSTNPSNSITAFGSYFTTTDHVYGAGEQADQTWPINSLPHSFQVPYVTGDFLSSPSQHWGGVLERYCLTSGGITIFVPENNPLFFTIQQLHGPTKKLCFESRYEAPYKRPEAAAAAAPDHKILLGAGVNVKEAHMNAIKNHFELPTGIPDERMMTNPIWSTWAMYKADIDEEKVLEFASAITNYGFTNSQLEIDDDWETYYGSAEFNQKKFPNVKDMVSTLKAKGFRVTLWIHPFINVDCPEVFEYADTQGFLVKDSQGKTSLTWWWNSKKAGIIDATNPQAVKWWTGRLQKLRDEFGIDSFKFDAGETGWLPSEYQLQVDPSLQPQQYTTSFVDMVTQFGPMLEVRVGFRSQRHPVFVRMLDKSSAWSCCNGLGSMIPSALLMGISGYPFFLPDMIGGNGYGPTGFPSKELYIRWAQVNAFMPALQLSIVPWVYDEETVNITRAATELHIKYADKIVELAKQATENGAPINRPLWWIAPEDEKALTCGDEFLLGDDLLVAPMVSGGTQRNIYLPAGRWRDEMDEVHPVYEGPRTLNNYKVQLHQLPYFIRV